MLKERKLLRYENVFMIGDKLYERGEKMLLGGIPMIPIWVI